MGPGPGAPTCRGRPGAFEPLRAAQGSRPLGGSTSPGEVAKECDVDRMSARSSYREREQLVGPSPESRALAGGTGHTSRPPRR